ncbi:MAG: aminoacyl-tRNA hydrolase [Candidatus Eremiobacteraeota bacterium]|nr:aminoacyl-tRNA hydrolase [Candidatus Eremiobacteraeota bacterium]
MEVAVIGLGNPGPEYSLTRHNLGFRVIDELACRAGVKLKRCARAKEAKAVINGHHLLLAKPLTFMNLSGRAVQSILFRHKIKIDHLLLISDDFNIPLGNIRLRKKGSSGGHRGIQSAIDLLGTGEFARLRIGIGHVPPGTDPVDFVLSAFSEEEEKIIKDVIPRAADMVIEWTREITEKENGEPSNSLADTGDEKYDLEDRQN